MTFVLQLGALAALSIVVPGIVVRTKSWWAGRRGAPVLQLWWDLRRLARKTPVYSEVATPVFRLAPWVSLVTAAGAAAVVPVLGVPSPVAFAGDFVWFAYLGGLGRMARVLAALDTGSPFEGMGASREASLSTLVEPVVFLALGAGVLASGASTLSGIVQFRPDSPAGGIVWAGMLAAWVVVVQVESARMPVDDPTTHLELTMIHEVLILDHSGPDLAAMQLGAGIRLASGLALVAAMLAPDGWPWWAASLAQGVGIGLGAVALGTVESLVARLRMRAIPSYLLAGGTFAVVAVLANLWVRA
ncbi:MAG: NADH-quinone oxidoreductase subunit H [Myxococcota bacterium]